MTRCYAITIPNLPDPILMQEEARQVAAFLRTLKGLIGFYPHYPEGTIMLFETLEDARMARARFTEQGNPCGDYIINAELTRDKSTVTMRDIAERVPEAGKPDLQHGSDRSTDEAARSF